LVSSVPDHQLTLVDTEFSHYYDKESTAIVVELRGLQISTSIVTSLICGGLGQARKQALLNILILIVICSQIRSPLSLLIITFLAVGFLTSIASFLSHNLLDKSK